LIENLFDHPQQWIDLLNQTHKKDDLCDSFLHAFYHQFGDNHLSSQQFNDDIHQYFETKYFQKDSKTNEKTIKIKI
jgi:hypothetical protein